MSPTYSVCCNHGYIAGEHYTCPDCGAKAEVYSRITGYYRPVQNWNDGKSQEFKQRKVYNIGNSKLTVKENVNAADECCCECAGEDQILLFATKTCPNCKIAASFLDKAGVKYEKLYAEDNAEACATYGIKQAPTLVVIKNGVAETIVNASNIRKYAESL